MQAEEPLKIVNDTIENIAPIDLPTYSTAIDIVLKYVTNVLKHPGDPKYRVIDVKNTVFSLRVGKLPDAIR